MDRQPTLDSTQEFAEFLQAEAEGLALTMPPPTTTKANNSGGAGQSVNGTPPTIKALGGGGYGGGDGQPKTKPACKYWGSASGCKRGDSCSFLHSWEGINKADRCFHCSGENHFAKDCPCGRDRGGKDGKKNAKVKGPTNPKEGVSYKELERRDESGSDSKGTTSPPSTTCLSSSKAPGSGEVETEKVVGEKDPATALLNEATSLLKTLRAMKAVKIKQLVHEDPTTTAASRYALLDGGATHALRQAEEWEYEGMKPIVVELAQGVSTSVIVNIFGAGGAW